MGFLCEPSIWEEYSRSLCCLDFICKSCAYFGVFFCCASVCNSVHRLLARGFPLCLLHSLVFCIKYYDTLVLILLIRRFFILLPVSDPNRHVPSGITQLPKFILLRDFAFSMCTSAFLEKKSPSWHPIPCVHQFGALHQLKSFSCAGAVSRQLYWWYGLTACFLGVIFTSTSG